MKRTGELLKKAREEKKLSLHEIGLSLKISNKVLKAIEEGDEKNLPAKTFLRGFVQSYANFLHLDTEKVLDVFYEEMGSTRHTPYIRPTESERPLSVEDVAAQAPVSTPLKEKVSPAPVEASNETPTVTENAAPAKEDSTSKEASVTPLRRRTNEGSKADGMQSLKENKNSKTIAIIIVAAVLIGLIIFMKKMIDKYSKEAEVPSGEIAQTIEGATPVSTDNATLEASEVDMAPTPATSPLSALTTKTPAPPVTSAVVATPSATPITVASPAVAASPSTSTKPTVSPSPTPSASPSPSVAVSPTVSPSATPSPSPTPEGNRPVELIVEALDTVEIEYSAPNGKPQKIKLSAEQVHTFKSRSGLKINFSNGGAVNLIKNGKEIGIPGDLGQPIKLSY